MAEPGMEAVNRTIAQRAESPAGSPPAPTAPGGPKPGGAQNPLETGIKLFDAVIFRLGQENPEAAEKLSAAIDGVKAIVEELKQGAGAAAPTPTGGEPRIPAPAPVPGGNRLPQ